MSNQQQQTKPPEAAATKPTQSSNADGRVEMPVAVLKFTGSTDVPGDDARSSLKSGGATNQRRWNITYLPWMRHHRIEYFEANKDKPTKVGYVHESSVRTWE